MESTTLPIDFDNYKKALQEYVSNTTEFRDVNYEGSGINQLLNILAYQATYLGYYLYVNDNEHYLQTAQTRSSVLAAAKRNGYVVKGRKCSRAEVKLERIVEDLPVGQYVFLSRDLHVVGNNKLTDVNRNFLFNQDVYLYDYEKTSDGKYKFTSDKTFTLYQGDRQVYRFQVSDDKSQRFVIKDDTIDVDTLRVFVKNTLSPQEIGEEYLASTNMVRDFGKDQKVFNVVTAENGWYEIFFGNDIIGKKPSLGQYIFCEYMSPTGEDGDGCDSFTLGGYKVITVSSSFGGSDGESIESVRHNAQYSFRRQNRLITAGDVKSILLEEFRNIKSINVWGGEDNYPKLYGKTMIAIKPNNSDALSQGAKIDIKKNLLSKYGYTNMDIILLDPEYLDVDVKVSLNLKKNISEESKQYARDNIISLVREYSDHFLNQFGYYLNDSEMNKLIMEKLPSVESIYSKKTISKTIEANTSNTSTYIVNINNAIKKGTVTAKFKDYNYEWQMFDDMKGNLICKTTNNLKEVIEKKVGTVDYKKGIYTFRLPLTSPISFEFVMEITAESEDPNIYSEQVNVVRVRTVEVANVL